ncbi:MAG: hypothetical protein D6705_06435 [Deltaproteobacteria bacterium]|nr:MAG: hypothetical protein D6705_06435 [Deltaproteobacteria bacterium]
MPVVSFSGLASGLDTASIVEGLLKVERIPIQRLEAENSDYRAQLGILDDLGAALGKLRTAAQDLDTLAEFAAYTATSTSEGVATATASGESVPGSYEVEVTALATAQKTYSNGFADADAALSASDQTLSLTIDGVTTDISVAAGATLRDVADAINASGADAVAGIFYDGSSYRLQVTGTETGAAAAISFTDTGLGLGLEDPANTVTAAQDAQLTVDGFAVTSSSNTLTDTLPGTTITLEGLGTTTITIDSDPTAVEEKVQAFVDAYNEVFGIINAQVGEGKGTDTLNGDATVRTIEQGLANLVTLPIGNLTDADGNPLILADLGIETNRDGTLIFDSTELSERLAEDFRGTARYFAGDDTAGVAGMGDLMDDLLDGYLDTTDGLLEARKDGINDRISDNEDRIDALEAYLATYEENLNAQFTALEQAMAAMRSQQSYLAQFIAKAG